MLMRGHGAHALTGALVVALIGCADCKTDSDCRDGQVCRNGSCVGLPGNDTSTDTEVDLDVIDDTVMDSVVDSSLDTSSDTDLDAVGCTDTACNAACVEYGSAWGECVDGACHCHSGSDVAVDWDVAPDFSGDTGIDPVEEWECTSDSECVDGNVCTTDHCSPVTHACAFLQVVDMTGCDDGVYCNGLEVCIAGVCSAGGEPCGSVEPICNPSVCDEGTRSCIDTPAADGTDCDDGSWCNGPEECSGGMCIRPGPQPCPVASEDPCMRIRCDDASTSCNEIPKVDGALCADEDICDGQEECWSGVCTEVPDLCDDSDPCTEDICDPGDDTTPPTCSHNDIC